MILITRPQLEAQELKEKLLVNKIDSHCDPLISFHHDDEWTRKQDIFDRNCVCLFTSVQAALSLEKKYSLKDFLNNKKIICIGERVSSYLKLKSVNNIINTFRDSDHLIAELDFEKLRENSFIYFCGNNYNTFLIEHINAKNIRCTPIVVYKVESATELDIKTKEMMEKNKIHSVVLYSQLSAQIFIELLQKANLADAFRLKKFFCLSNKIETIAKTSNFMNTIVATTPDEESMVDVIKKSLLMQL